MKKEQLIELKNKVLEEQNRRKRNNELIKNELVQEYIRLHKLSMDDESLDIEDILNCVLEGFEIKETNRIYVLTDVFETRWEDYLDHNTYDVSVEFDSKNARYKEYRNIENCKFMHGYLKYEDVIPLTVYAKDFEKEYIVLNPHNTSEDKNGFERIRIEFLLESIISNQEEAKEKLLKKYPRL